MLKLADRNQHKHDELEVNLEDFLFIMKKAGMFSAEKDYKLKAFGDESNSNVGNSSRPESKLMVDPSVPSVAAF